ncbi:hypothetical protein PHISCL_09999 [Aspergillus sclerotialis]|uniref:Uncharacterized protein n=1 Tax=Aspergillus sclerotialis TaxID=2070753 RepID=A0A3A2ZIG1_9EURO|nr:hypothetical protein PHISCL_09999 [Aspergillus sclerotialis]
MSLKITVFLSVTLTLTLAICLVLALFVAYQLTYILLVAFSGEPFRLQGFYPLPRAQSQSQTEPRTPHSAGTDRIVYARLRLRKTHSHTQIQGRGQGQGQGQEQGPLATD